MISREKRHYIIKANRLFGTENLDLGLAAELAQQCNELEDYKKAADRQLDSTVAECDRMRDELGRVTKARNEWADKCNAAIAELDRLRAAHAVALDNDAQRIRELIARAEAAERRIAQATSQEAIGRAYEAMKSASNNATIEDFIRRLVTAAMGGAQLSDAPQDKLDSAINTPPLDISENDKLQAELDEAERLIIALNEHEGWSGSLRADLNVFLSKRKLGKSLTQLASSEWHQLPPTPQAKG